MRTRIYLSSLGNALTSSRLSWQNKGYRDARYQDVKNPPDDPKAREAYFSGHRAGRRERLEAEAEGRP